MKIISIVLSFNDFNDSVKSFIQDWQKKCKIESELILNSNVEHNDFLNVQHKNDGIKIAKGKYIIFLTPDIKIDYIELKNNIDIFNYDFDILMSGYNYYSNETKSEVNNILTNELGIIPLLKREMPFSPLKKPDFTWNINDEIFNKFYKKDFLIKNHLYFKDEFEKQDFVFNFETLLKSKDMLCAPKPIIKKDLITPNFTDIGNLFYMEDYLRNLLSNDKLKSLFNKKISKYYSSFESNKLKAKAKELLDKCKKYDTEHSKLSVIITFYNIAPYVKDCLESILNQSYKDIEIICVDDCSSDETVKEIKKFKALHNDIKIIECKENGGAATARNIGLKHATGDFITFVDGDDWLYYDTYSMCINEINKRNCDFVMYNTMGFEEKYKRPVKKTFFNITMWKNCKIENYALCALDSIKNIFFGNLSACNKVYRKTFLKEHDIKFEEHIEFEDYKFHALTMLSANTIGIVNYPCYVYRTLRSGSTCNTIHNSDKIAHLFNVFDYINAILDKNDFKKSFQYQLIEFEFEILNFWYGFIPFSKSKRMFNKIQQYFKKIDFEKLDYNKYSTYTNYDILMDFLSSNWFVMYYKSRFFNGQRNIIKRIKNKIEEL